MYKECIYAFWKCPSLNNVVPPLQMIRALFHVMVWYYTSILCTAARGRHFCSFSGHEPRLRTSVTASASPWKGGMLAFAWFGRHQGIFDYEGNDSFFWKKHEKKKKNRPTPMKKKKYFQQRRGWMNPLPQALEVQLPPFVILYKFPSFFPLLLILPKALLTVVQM